MLREPAQRQRALGDLGLRGGERLAHLGGDHASDVGLLGIEDVGCGEHPACSIGEARPPVTLESVARRSDTAVDLVWGVAGEGRLDDAGGRVDGSKCDRSSPRCSRSSPTTRWPWVVVLAGPARFSSWAAAEA